MIALEMHPLDYLEDGWKIPRHDWPFSNSTK
jgi:hypothetical protein